METKRRYNRYSTNLMARYSFDAKKAWQECTIISIGRGGVGLEYIAYEKIDIGSTINLEIFTSEGLETISIEGNVRWIKQGENYINAGVEVISEFDQDKLANLIKLILS
ncbi:MAG: PilZ domain-containing protein [Deltaproteobacteria bacterium]|nr:PilZ domain-containing protein [Deltaproteobacteria bacterium]